MEKMATFWFGRNGAGRLLGLVMGHVETEKNDQEEMKDLNSVILG